MAKKGFINEKFKIAVGQRFGKLVIESVHSRPGSFAEFEVLCDCGERRMIRAAHVISGNSKSCGCGKSWHVLPFGEASLRKLYRRYQNNAKHANRSFSLLPEDFRRLTSSPCHYCGEPPAQTVHGRYCNGPYVYNGLDRVDNSKGYLLDNVVPACPQCQYGKRDQPVEVFLKWLQRAAKFQSAPR